MSKTMRLTTLLKKLGADNSGATAVEYGLIVSLIVIAMIGAFVNFADSNDRVWNEVSDAYDEANGT
ncbi:MAG: Flp family type IVb pilin [Pseudomonadota bacterium]